MAPAGHGRAAALQAASQVLGQVRARLDERVWNWLVRARGLPPLPGRLSV